MLTPVPSSNDSILFWGLYVSLSLRHLWSPLDTTYRSSLVPNSTLEFLPPVSRPSNRLPEEASNYLNTRIPARAHRDYMVEDRQVGGLVAGIAVGCFRYTYAINMGLRSYTAMICLRAANLMK